MLIFGLFKKLYDVHSIWLRKIIHLVSVTTIESRNLLIMNLFQGPTLPTPHQSLEHKLQPNHGPTHWNFIHNLWPNGYRLNNFPFGIQRAPNVPTYKIKRIRELLWIVQPKNRKSDYLCNCYAVDKAITFCESCLMLNSHSLFIT